MESDDEEEMVHETHESTARRGHDTDSLDDEDSDGDMDSSESDSSESSIHNANEKEALQKGKSISKSKVKKGTKMQSNSLQNKKNTKTKGPEIEAYETDSELDCDDSVIITKKSKKNTDQKHEKNSKSSKQNNDEAIPKEGLAKSRKWAADSGESSGNESVDSEDSEDASDVGNEDVGEEDEDDGEDEEDEMPTDEQGTLNQSSRRWYIRICRSNGCQALTCLGAPVRCPWSAVLHTVARTGRLAKQKRGDLGRTVSRRLGRDQGGLENGAGCKNQQARGLHDTAEVRF